MPLKVAPLTSKANYNLNPLGGYFVHKFGCLPLFLAVNAAPLVCVQSAKALDLSRPTLFLPQTVLGELTARTFSGIFAG
jgi:hypothetical protein